MMSVADTVDNVASVEGMIRWKWRDSWGRRCIAMMII